MPPAFFQKNPIEYTDLIFRKHALRTLTTSSAKPVNGVDTETYHGYCRLLCDSTGHYLIGADIDSILRFLTARHFRSAHNFFYNIRFDFQAIVKYLPYPLLKELYETGTCTYRTYQLSYIPRKLFKIIHYKHVYAYYDLFVFFQQSLEEAAYTHLGKHKNIENIDRERLNVDNEYWNKEQWNIIRYCLHDAMLTKQLGDFLQKEFIEKVGFYPRRYLSRASVAKEYYRTTCVIPSLQGIPPEALAFAFNAYHGGRFENTQRGYFTKASLIDIVSCYPYHIANLIDVTGSTWKEVTEADGNATYGFYLAQVTIPYMYIAPIAFRLSPSYTIFPCGQFYTFLTLEEIQAYRDTIDIRIIRGYETIIQEPQYPFRKAIHELFELKRVTPKEDFRYELIKRLLNSIYGAFYEKVNRNGVYITGKLFNPIYASIITANARIQLWNKGKEYKNRVIAFATDSVLINGDTHGENSKTLGGWSYETCGEAVVLRSGIYDLEGRFKSRGVSKKEKVVGTYGEYKNIFKYIKAYPLRTKYPIYSNRPVNLGEALIQHERFNIEDINVWYTFRYEIDINNDLKRNWYDTFLCGKELFTKNIDSIPIITDDFTAKYLRGNYARCISAKHKGRINDYQRIREQPDVDINKDIDSQLTTKHQIYSEIRKEKKASMTHELEIFREFDE